MDFVNELAQLQKMYDAGMLTEEEFRLAKAFILPNHTPQEQQLQELRRQNQVLQIDREWDRERLTYLNRDHQPPRKEDSLWVAGSGVLMALVFAFSWSMGWAKKTIDPVTMIMLFIVLPLIVVAGTISTYLKAMDYEAAKQRYRKKRERLLQDIEQEAE